MNSLTRFTAISVWFLAHSVVSADVERTVVEVPVTGVEPITQFVTRKIPHESCREEQVRVERTGGNHSTTPAILGAVIGGVMGGALGHNSQYQPVAAGAGALLGASVGHDVSHSRTAQSYYMTEQRCEVDYELRDQENVIGYRVSYLYGDSTYETETQYPPGSTIKIRVELIPVE